MRTAPKSERKYDGFFVRNLIASEIKESGLSRDQIADRMTENAPRPVSARQLNAWTAESREDWLFPAEMILPFCEAVGRHKLLAEFVKRAGFRMVGTEEERLLRIGRAWEQKRKAEQILAGGGK